MSSKDRIQRRGNFIAWLQWLRQKFHKKISRNYHFSYAQVSPLVLIIFRLSLKFSFFEFFPQNKIKVWMCQCRMISWNYFTFLLKLPRKEIFFYLFLSRSWKIGGKNSRKSRKSLLVSWQILLSFYATSSLRIHFCLTVIFPSLCTSTWGKSQRTYIIIFLCFDAT